jgi:hypothetical protein
MAPGASLARRVRRAGAACWVALPLAALGCDGEVLNLGSSGLQAGGGSGAGGSGGGGVVAPHIWEVRSTPIVTQVKDLLVANPTLTEDEHYLFYSEQERYGNPEPKPRIMRAAWDGAVPSGIVEQKLGALVMPDISSPVISAKGTELWLGMLNGDNTDIFKSELQGDAWTTPLRVAELCSSDYDDAPRQPAAAGTIMPLSSKRHGGLRYQIYLSNRENENAVWNEPSKALLGPVNADAFQSADGFLNSTGLELYFSSTRDGSDSDLYVSRRARLTDAFGEPEALTDLNDPDGRSEERMPWLSLDEQRLYFVSDRTGQYTLYLATKR